MLDTVCTLILMFFVFSCAGWIMEVVLKYFEFHRFINRGFLIGPYCPIYGFGVVAVTVVVGGMVGRHGTLGEVFFAGMVMCGALEYFTSWYMEKMFHKLSLTARTYHKILRVARTIADTQKAENIRVCDLTEAVCYRSIGDKFWGGMEE